MHKFKKNRLSYFIMDPNERKSNDNYLNEENQDNNPENVTMNLTTYNNNLQGGNQFDQFFLQNLDDTNNFRLFNDYDHIDELENNQNEITKVEASVLPLKTDLKNIYYLNPNNYKLQTIQTKECFPILSSIVFVDFSLFISGGIINNVKNSSLYKLDLMSIEEKYSYTKESDLEIARSEHTSFYENEYIYFVGGVNQPSVQRYHLENKSLENLPSLNYPRERCGCVIVNNTYLYVLFGKKYLDTKNELYSNVERLDLVKLDKWNIVLYDAKLPLYSFCILKYDNSIYICGGEKKEGKSREIFTFDANEMTINKYKNLPKPISFIHNYFLEIDDQIVNINQETNEFIYFNKNNKNFFI
jgi:hypothetical protein